MKGKVVVEKKFILEMGEDETRWLWGVMQNPLVEDESEEDAVYRKALFEALSVQRPGQEGES